MLGAGLGDEAVGATIRVLVTGASLASYNDNKTHGRNDGEWFVLALAEQVERREPCRRVPLIVKASDSDVCGFIECIADLECRTVAPSI